MSSSRILRGSFDSQQSFTLAPLGEQVSTPEPDVFRPVSLGEPEPQPEVEEALEYLAPPSIPEEEAVRRIQQAHAEGLKEGRRQADEQFARVSEALGQALLATGTLRSRLMQEAEEDLLKLSVQIARTIMQRELACDPWILAQVVHHAVETAADGGEMVVRLNPDDYQMVARRPEFAVAPGEKRKVILKEDPAIPGAGCLVETGRGTLDAGLAAQLDEIYRRLCEEKCTRRAGGNGGD
ncbi:hypothetical protein GMLC_08900 [Geomonas limicola]|uniref:Flagellar assembly protein FliH n=1 Tax=Geomonas limicola TaxID=2740186 RepID=A0A6V8N4F6_9BACT|nr:FliH/SctL family protein [Geomonas limicola]GFO67311.1 hypothetical protein GMLC_08900 [Geomonas limicola]